MGIVGSVVPAILRFFIVIGVTAIGIARVDQPILPNWALKILWLDLANSTYLSSVVMHNNHNHPVFVTIAMKLCNMFNKLLDEDALIQGKIKSVSFLKARNMFQMARLLIKNPDLKKYRIRPIKEIEQIPFRNSDIVTQPIHKLH